MGHRRDKSSVYTSGIGNGVRVGWGQDNGVQEGVRLHQ